MSLLKNKNNKLKKHLIFLILNLLVTIFFLYSGYIDSKELKVAMRALGF